MFSVIFFLLLFLSLRVYTQRFKIAICFFADFINFCYTVFCYFLQEILKKEETCIMKEFLKYLKMISVILYPYIYVFILAGFLMFMSSLPEDYNDAAMLGLLIVAVIYNLYSLVIVIVNAVQGARGKVTARQAARMNLIIKGIQIPAYIMHFIPGFIGLALSVWGIGFILWAILIDLLTGISSIDCCIRMRKGGLLSTATVVG